MELEYIDGCICQSTNVNGVELVDMRIIDIKNVVKKLVDKEEDTATLQSIFIDLVRSQGDFEDLGQCEQCGDYIYKYKAVLDCDIPITAVDKKDEDCSASCDN